MSSPEEIATDPDRPLFVVGISGRLPLRTACALELSHAELPRHLRRWRSLLGDRLRAASMDQLPHPSRLVKREHAATMRGLTEALADFPLHHVHELPKRHAQQAERDILDWLCGFLDGHPFGLAVFHTVGGISWYHLTPKRSRPLDTWTLPHDLVAAEELLSAAKLASYAVYQDRCYPHAGCRPIWLPSKLHWA
ncbi:hypothetical protein ACFW6K_13450 [Streptomyces sp. NPDC058733]|uniref:hypothetical protein n=1 Tax=Streptomyces sp. NPDC058733 TaxID=3346614 RepID=UPI0036B1FF20